MILSAAVAVLVGLISGFVTGGLVYRQSRRWCKRCGSPLQCAACPTPGQPTHPGPDAASQATSASSHGAEDRVHA